MSNDSGIYHHKGLVYPYSIDISSNRIVAYCEEGFTLDLPKDRRVKAQVTFLECCLKNETDPRMIEYIENQIEEVKDENRCAVSKALRKVFKGKRRH